MGRFYKTSKPEMIDFMFKVPEQAMLTAIKGMDAQLEGQESYLTDLQKQLKTAALDPDEDKRKARVTELEGKIREHSLKIFENPLAAIKEQRGIRDLGQEIYKDLTEGELYAYNTNAKKRAEFHEEQMKKATQKDGTIRVQDVDEAMRVWDLNYKAQEGAQFNKQTGKFNPYGTQSIINYVDVAKYADSIASKMKTHKDERWRSYKEGGWWMKESNAYEILGLDEATFGTYAMMMNNKDLTDRANYDIRIKALNIALSENRMGDLKAIEDEERAKVFGLRDENTNELILEPVLNEDGTQKMEKVKIKDADNIEKEVEKPVMKPVEEGSLLKTARAAADLYDINDYKGGILVDKVDNYNLEQFKSNLRKQEEAHKEALKQPVVYDIKSSSVTQAVLNGKNYTEVKTNLDNSKKMLDDKLNVTKAELLKAIAGQITNSNEYAKIEKEIGAFLNSDNPNWGGLNKYLGSKNLLGINLSNGETVATNVQNYQNEYITSLAEYQNQKTFFDKIMVEADKTLPPYLQQNVLDNLKLQQEKNARLAAETKELVENYDRNPSSMPGVNIGELRKELLKYENEAKRLKGSYDEALTVRNAMLNANVNFDATTEGSVNRVSKEVYGIAGDLFSGAGASFEDVTHFKKLLTSIQKQGFANTKNSTRSKIMVNGQLQDFNANDLMGILFVGQDILSQTTDDNGNQEIITKNGKFKYEISDVRLIRDNITGVGEHAWQYTVKGTDPKTNQPKQYYVYQPYEELQNNQAKSLVTKYEPDMAYENFLTDAKSRNGLDYIDTHSQTRGAITYKKIGNKDWIMFEYIENGRKKEKMFEAGTAEAKNLYKSIYSTKPN